MEQEQILTYLAPNLHIKLSREGKQILSLAEQKKPSLIKMQLNWRRRSLRTIFKSSEETVYPHQCISVLRLFYFLPNNTELLPQLLPGSPLRDFFLQFWSNAKNAEDAHATEVMQKYPAMTTITAPLTHIAASRSSWI